MVGRQLGKPGISAPLVCIDVGPLSLQKILCVEFRELGSVTPLRVLNVGLFGPQQLLLNFQEFG